VIHHWNRLTRPVAAATTPPSVEWRGKPARPDKIKVIGIAASTGGPAALATILRQLPARFPMPILIVQHITDGFASGLAEWLSHQTDLCVNLAGHGDALTPGTILIAPDNYHMRVNARGVVELCKEAPYRGLRPSANPLFQSLAHVYGPRAAGVILTGMGDDGSDGLESLHAAGGLTIAQDEQSSVVFGMPHEAIARNAIEFILPIEQIGLLFNQLADVPAGVTRDE
jgi:two-component system chemotaxis response regulator CheB